MLFAQICCLEKPIFGSANVISTWIKFLLPGLISKYNILNIYQYDFIKIKIVPKGVIVVENIRFELNLFPPVLGKFSSFVDPRLKIPTATSKKESIPSDGKKER